MRRLIATGAAAAALAFALTACSTPADSSPTASSSPSASATATAAADRTGSFSGLNDKKVAGTATVSADRIALAGFSSDEGPDLHVYLANGTAESDIASGKQIAAVKWDASTQTFALSGVDASAYRFVVIHCDKAKAVFGAAELS